MARRGYNARGRLRRLGRLNAGLFFMAYQRHPRTAFVPVQQHLARHDAMSEYLRHVSGALFARPPGVRDAGDFRGPGRFA